MEKLIEHPRHIEFQVLGDQHGNVIHLGERECSHAAPPPEGAGRIPSPAIDADTRAQNGQRRSSDALQEIGYTSAGTVEFLRDESGKLYFIEMNARIQVEHPVTEMVTGVDLVKSQIRIAAGEKLENVRAARSNSAATPSNAASTPKIPKHLSLPPDASPLSAFPAAPAFASTPPAMPTP